jgi:hypothetical protein
VGALSLTKITKGRGSGKKALGSQRDVAFWDVTPEKEPSYNPIFTVVVMRNKINNDNLKVPIIPDLHRNTQNLLYSVNKLLTASSTVYLGVVVLGNVKRYIKMVT